MSDLPAIEPIATFQVERIVREAIADAIDLLGEQTVLLSSTWRDLAADRVDIMEAVLGVERRLGIVLPGTLPRDVRHLFDRSIRELQRRKRLAADPKPGAA